MRLVRFIIFASIIFLFVNLRTGVLPVGNISKDAPSNRGSDSIEKVTPNFQIPTGQTGIRYQTATVLSLVSELLLKKHEWAIAANMYKQIMANLDVSNVSEACDNTVHACLPLNQPEIATTPCAKSKTKLSQHALEEFANQWNLFSPEIAHAQLEDFLAKSADLVRTEASEADSVQSFPATGPVAVHELSASSAIEIQVGSSAETISAPASKTAEFPGMAENSQLPQIQENPLPAEIHDMEDAQLSDSAPPSSEASPDLATSTEANSTIDIQAKPQNSEIKGILPSIRVGDCQSALPAQIGSNDMIPNAHPNTDSGNQAKVALNDSQNGSSKEKFTFDNIDHGLETLLKIKSAYFDVSYSHLLKTSESDSWKFCRPLGLSETLQKPQIKEYPLHAGILNMEDVQPLEPSISAGSEAIPDLPISNEVKENIVSQSEPPKIKMEEFQPSIGVQSLQSNLPRQMDSKGINDQLPSGYIHRVASIDSVAKTPLKIKSAYFDVSFSPLLNEPGSGSWKFLSGAKFSRPLRLAVTLQKPQTKEYPLPAEIMDREPDLLPTAKVKGVIDSQTKPQKSEVKQNLLSVGARGWQSDLSGQLTAKGMSLDTDHDADFGVQTQVALTGSWNVSRNNQLQLGYMHFDHAGLLKKKVTFNNLDYGIGAPLKIKSGYFDIALSHLLKESDSCSWKFLFGAKFSRTFMRLEQQFANGLRSGELTQSLSVPYLGIEGNGKVSANIFLDVALKYIALNGTRAHLTDFDIALLFGRDYVKTPSETELYGSLGYRYFSLRGKTDCDIVEIRYSGPAFGLEGRF